MFAFLKLRPLFLFNCWVFFNVLHVWFFHTKLWILCPSCPDGNRDRLVSQQQSTKEDLPTDFTPVKSCLTASKQVWQIATSGQTATTHCCKTMRRSFIYSCSPTPGWLCCREGKQVSQINPWIQCWNWPLNSLLKHKHWPWRLGENFKLAASQR